jgi:histone H3/H4
MYISESTARRILREAGAARISDDAAVEFHKHINKYAYDVAEKAVKLAKHAKRKTIDSSDVKLAVR